MMSQAIGQMVVLGDRGSKRGFDRAGGGPTLSSLASQLCAVWAGFAIIFHKNQVLLVLPGTRQNSCRHWFNLFVVFSKY